MAPSSKPGTQPFRHVHLDFHTSESIDGVARDFDPARFADTLKRARVASVQLFARCWHGWMYYDSKRFPDAVHPRLTRRDLLPRQIEACHAVGIRAPIYVAIQVDRRNAFLHPEWVQLRPDARLGKRGCFQPGLGPDLCVNSPFADFLFEHVDEILDTMPADGFWFDGLTQQNCCCRHCQIAMLARGLNPQDESDRRTFGDGVVVRFAEQMTERVRRRVPGATVFYNGGHIGPRHRALTGTPAGSYTHLEIESLPGGGWGYLHFPIAARLARTMNADVVGMTGKFHTSWGDFHSFKNAAALEFECFQMLAQGARCSIGDQLHPRGTPCEETYRRIGEVFAAVEAVEPWCRGFRPLAEAALLTSESHFQQPWDTLLPKPIIGATRLFQEIGLQFDIVERDGPWENYPLLIVPDDMTFDTATSQRVSRFLASGGKVLATCRGGWNADGVAPPEWGVEPTGAAPWAVDFLRPTVPGFASLPRTEHVMYQGAQSVRATSGSATLAQVVKPFFDRTWQHFCSHMHAPSTGEACGDAVVQRGDVIYCAHPLLSIYRDHAPRWVKEIVRACLTRLTGGLTLSHNGPSNLIAAVHGRASDANRVIHLLHYVPERRGTTLDVIEERQTVCDLGLRLRCPTLIRAARAVPRGEPLAVEPVDEGTWRIRVPRLDGRMLILVETDS